MRGCGLTPQPVRGVTSALAEVEKQSNSFNRPWLEFTGHTPE
jgi:hypothetical protein